MLALAASLHPSLAAAEQYWSYEDKGIDVIAPGTEEHARNIVQHLHRLDLAITKMLGIKTLDSRQPAHVYAFPGKLFSVLLGKKADFESIYMASGFDSTILIDASGGATSRYFGANSGYASSILMNAYSFRYPDWFIKGISEVFGATTMDSKLVTLGTFEPARVEALYSGTWIPLKTLLTLHADDHQLDSDQYIYSYTAECFFLTHLIVIEGKYHSNFFNYFLLLEQGMDENKAFAASFDISMEELDKIFHDAVRVGRLSLVKVAIPEDLPTGQAVKLSDAEVKGRMASLAAHYSIQTDEALRMANEVLKTDPNNTSALHALALGEFRNAAYAPALQAADHGCSGSALSQSDFAQCGDIFFKLAQASSSKRAELPIDRPALAERSRQYFDKAIEMDRDDLASWAGMANLFSGMHDVEHAKTFLPSAEMTSYRHPRNGAYAYALSCLCASIGDYQNALKFAVAWKNNAVNESQRAAATAYISQLREYLQRTKLATSAPIQ
jgi:tetratricopeptide (TPR) repeat protein